MLFRSDILIHSEDIRRLDFDFDRITSWQIIYEKPKYTGKPILKGSLAGCSYLALENLSLKGRKYGYVIIGNIYQNPELLEVVK